MADNGTGGFRKKEKKDELGSAHLAHVRRRRSAQGKHIEHQGTRNIPRNTKHAVTQAHYTWTWMSGRGFQALSLYFFLSFFVNFFLFSLQCIRSNAFLQLFSMSAFCFYATMTPQTKSLRRLLDTNGRSWRPPREHTRTHNKKMTVTTRLRFSTRHTATRFHTWYKTIHKKECD